MVVVVVVGMEAGGTGDGTRSVVDAGIGPPGGGPARPTDVVDPLGVVVVLVVARRVTGCAPSSTTTSPGGSSVTGARLPDPPRWEEVVVVVMGVAGEMTGSAAVVIVEGATEEVIGGEEGSAVGVVAWAVGAGAAAVEDSEREIGPVPSVGLTTSPAELSVSSVEHPSRERVCV